MKTMYTVLVETSDLVAGNKSHGAIYPMFSRMPRAVAVADGEECQELVTDKITVEDGRFARANARYGYTGQHTDLEARIEDGVIHTSSPYIEGTLYSRNKYGATTRVFRLNLEARCLERPTTRNGKTTWRRFEPAQYID